MPLQLKELVPPPFEMPRAVLSKRGLRKRKRPLTVTLVALYQFCRALSLLAIVASLFGASTVDLTVRAHLRALIYLVTRQDMTGQSAPVAPILTIFALLAAYYVAIGLGLLFLDKWARRAAMLMSGMGMVRLIFLVLVQNQDLALPKLLSQQEVLACFVLVDAMVLGLLVNEGETFRTTG